MAQNSQPTDRAPGSRIPLWAPLVLFGVLALALFREFVVSGDMIFGTDVIALGYFARSFYADFVREYHAFPLWNPYVFGGLPFVDAMHGDIFYPTTVLKFLLPVHQGMGWKLVLHVFLAGVVTYGWLRHLRVRRIIAVWGGVAYMLAPVLVSLVYPGHDGKLFVTALTPLLLWSADAALVRGRLWRYGVLAIVVALLIFTAHMQLAYFATWAVGVLTIYRSAQAWRREEGRGFVVRRFTGVVAAGLIGAGAIGAVQLWTPLRYLTTYSQRVEKTTAAQEQTGYEYSTTWSLHPEEAFSLVVPEFIGANLQTASGRVNTYWGRNAFKLNHEYAGFIPLLLLPLAFLTRRRRGEVWLFTGLAAGALIYGLGATTPLFRLFYWLVPGVKLFRAPSSIMFVFAIAVVTAAALALQGMEEVRSDPDAEGYESTGRRYLWGATGFLVLLAFLGSGGTLTDMWTATIYSGIEPEKLRALEANLPNIRQGLWVTVALAAMVAGAWEARVRDKLPQAGWVAALIALSILDLWRVDAAFIRVIDPGRIFPRDDVTEFLIERSREAEPFRTLPVAAPYQMNHFAFHEIEELTGHHGNELGRYMELVDQGMSFRVLNLLNVRYVVSGRPLDAPGLRQVYEGRHARIYEIPAVLPRAFVVSDYETMPDSLMVPRLLSPDMDPERTAILSDTVSDRWLPDSRAPVQARVQWREHEVNQSELVVDVDGEALLIIGDNYYPAWRATVDGATVPVLRANHTLRAVPLSAGEHVVRLEYRSATLLAAGWTTVLSLLATLSIVGWSYARRRESGNDGERNP